VGGGVSCNHGYSLTGGYWHFNPQKIDKGY